jgi:hypothetical protein
MVVKIGGKQAGVRDALFYLAHGAFADQMVSPGYSHNGKMLYGAGFNGAGAFTLPRAGESSTSRNFPASAPGVNGFFSSATP